MENNGGPSNFMVPAGFTNFSALTLPVAWCDHDFQIGDSAAAVIGSYVYRGPNQPRMNGMYFLGDFVVGWVWGLEEAERNWEMEPLLVPGNPDPNRYEISTFGEDDEGQLYMADYAQGIIYQVVDSRQTWTPSFSVPSGFTINSNMVTVTCLTTNAPIHYTTNGVDPTPSDPAVVSGAAGCPSATARPTSSGRFDPI